MLQLRHVNIEDASNISPDVLCNVEVAIAALEDSGLGLRLDTS